MKLIHNSTSIEIRTLLGFIFVTFRFTYKSKKKTEVKLLLLSTIFLSFFLSSLKAYLLDFLSLIEGFLEGVYTPNCRVLEHVKNIIHIYTSFPKKAFPLQKQALLWTSTISPYQLYNENILTFVQFSPVLCWMLP